MRVCVWVCVCVCVGVCGCVCVGVLLGNWRREWSSLWPVTAVVHVAMLFKVHVLYTAVVFHFSTSVMAKLVTSHSGLPPTRSRGCKLNSLQLILMGGLILGCGLSSMRWRDP